MDSSTVRVLQTARFFLPDLVLVLADLAIPDDPDAEALDGERVALQVYMYRCEIRVLRQQLYLAALAFEALDRDFVVQAGDHDLPGAGFAGAVYRQQVAVEDAGIAHAHAAYLQQVIRARLEHPGVQLIAFLDMGFGKDRTACRDPADQRQAELLFQPDAA